ncbi:MAG: DinB family protein [Allomuricauda sp.]|nr:MAG: DinB family protein [Allomuricauda sp.]
MTPKTILFFFSILLFTTNLQSQTMQLPYSQIPEYAESYSSGNIVARMVDGLGFRYYWATEGLTEKDLNFQPTAESRTALETLQHIYGMSEMILNAPDAQPNIRPKDFSKYSFGELRKMTLDNLQAASTKYRAMQTDSFDASKVIFQRGEKQFDFPFWNLLNGMLSDCIYHAGQITLMRRMSGNPINPKVNVFLGKLNE